MGILPSPSTVDGAYDWLLILTILFAALLWVLILASAFGLLPMIDRLDGGGAVVLPVAGRIGSAGLRRTTG